MYTERREDKETGREGRQVQKDAKTDTLTQKQDKTEKNRDRSTEVKMKAKVRRAKTRNIGKQTR